MNMITPEEANRISQILEEEAGRPVPERLKRVLKELPHATADEIQMVLRTQIELANMEILDGQAEQAAAQKMLQLLDRAETIAGIEMNTGDAVAFMAARAEAGDEEAKALLEGIKDPFLGN